MACVKKILGLCGVLLSLAVGARADEAPRTIHFGLLAVESAEQVQANWAPVLAALESRLGVKVIAHVSKDYAGVIWALRQGDDQLAWLGNKSAIEAVDRAESEVFAQQVYPSGIAGYYSLLITAPDSSLHSVDDVFAHASELTLGSGDTNSTSGFLAPSYFLFAARGTSPHRIFKRVVQASHEDNVLAVLDRRLDVATVASNHMEHVLKVWGRPNPLVLWRSPLIPGDPLVWRRDLADDLKRRVRGFFLEYGVPSAAKSATELKEERANLARLDISRFAASDDRQLLPVRRIELFRDRLQVESNGDLSAEERQKRLAEIDARLAAIPAVEGPR